METQLKKIEADQKHRQDYDAHLLRSDLIVRLIFSLIIGGFAIIGFFWFIDNAIMPIVHTMASEIHR